MFVGQRKDPFVVNLGEVFDLVNTNPLGPESGERDVLEDKNITSLILEVPISFLTSGSETVIGGWTSATLSRPSGPSSMWGSFAGSSGYGGARQVSRLGMPLVNELVIGLPDKDKFNASRPRNDACDPSGALPLGHRALPAAQRPCRDLPHGS